MTSALKYLHNKQNINDIIVKHEQTDVTQACRLQWSLFRLRAKHGVLSKAIISLDIPIVSNIN